MRFTKIITKNFQGLTGVNTFEFIDKFAIFVGENGVGKTSLLNAIRYVLTGTEPTGQVITEGENSMNVTIFTDDGHAYTRGKNEKGNCWYIDKKAVNLSTFNAAVGADTPVATMKNIVSSDVISSMSPKDFSDFLFTFVNSVDKEALYASIDEDVMTSGVRMILDDYFRNETVTTSEINELYKKEKARRAALAKSLAEKEGQKKALAKNGLQPAMHTKDELNEMFKAARENEKKANAYKAQLKAYEDAEKARTKQLTLIENINKNIEGIIIPEIKTEDKSVYENAIKTEQAKKDAAIKASATYKALIDSVEKSLANLNTSVCPLSEKLMCTTDKSGIKKELEDSVAAAKDALAQAEADAKTAQTNIDNALASIKEIEKIKQLTDKKASLEKQKADMEASLVVLPEKPEALNTEEITAQAEAVRKEIADYKNYEQYTLINQEYIKEKQNYDDVTAALTLFASKGPVKRMLTENVLNKLTTACKKASSEFKDMDILFEATDAGIVFTARTKENGPYIGFKSLSGGEKAKVMYAIMSALCELSGFRVLLMDELSVLDTEGLTTLMEILKTNSDSFDLIMINAVNHSDIMDAFAAASLSTTTLNK